MVLIEGLMLGVIVRYLEKVKPEMLEFELQAGSLAGRSRRTGLPTDRCRR